MKNTLPISTLAKHKSYLALVVLTFISFILSILFLSPTPPIQAATGVPKLLNFQGRLTDSSDNLLTGTYYICFWIYDAESAGSKVWPTGDPTPQAVTVTNGIFSTQVGGGGNTLDASFNDDSYWLAVDIDPDNDGDCTTGGDTLAPRQRITAASYAITASNLAGTSIDVDAATLDLSTQAVGFDLIDSTVNALSFETNLLSLDTTNSRVGIGTTTPTAFLDLPASTASTASLNLTSSAATNPSAPVSGDLWWNGTNFYFYDGSTSQDLLAGGSLWTQTGSDIYYDSGNVGIGTTSPDNLLSLNQASGDVILDFDLADADKWVLGIDDSDGDKFEINSGSAFADASDFELDSSGNLAILGDFTVTGGGITGANSEYIQIGETNNQIKLALSAGDYALLTTTYFDLSGVTLPGDDIEDNTVDSSEIQDDENPPGPGWSPGTAQTSDYTQLQPWPI